MKRVKNVKVKIFQGKSENEINNLEKEINEWLASDPKKDVIRSDISSSGIGKLQNQFVNSLVVLVWYEVRPKIKIGGF